MLPLRGSCRQRRLRGSAALLVLLTLAACSPKSEPEAPAALTLDCTLDFKVQADRVTAQPNLAAPSHAPGEPYTFYSTTDGKASYLITEPGAPGHPAIMMQDAIGGQVKTTGCAYGDKRGYQQLLTYLDSLKTWSRR